MRKTIILHFYTTISFGYLYEDILFFYEIIIDISIAGRRCDVFRRFEYPLLRQELRNAKS